jgi:hypothetical protein
MPDTNYMIAGTSQGGTGFVCVSISAASSTGTPNLYSTTQARIATKQSANTNVDAPIVCVSAFR